MSDRYLHSDRAAVIYIARQRDGIKRQRHQKAAKNFFSHRFTAACPTSPSPQLLIINRADEHVTAGYPYSPSEGPQTLFFLFYSLLWGNLPFHRSMQESPVGLLHCMDGVRGRSAPRIPQKGEAQALLCPAVRTPSTHSRPVLIFCPLPRDRETLEVSSLFARTLGSPQGARYLLQEPLSSGQ